MSEMLKEARIGIECEMTNPPKPKCFGIFQEGRVTAILSIEDVLEAVQRYEVLVAARVGWKRVSINHDRSLVAEINTMWILGVTQK